MTTTALTTLGLAQALCSATGDSLVVIDASNAGSDSRWRQHFPSLDEEQIADVHERLASAFPPA